MLKHLFETTKDENTETIHKYYSLFLRERCQYQVPVMSLVEEVVAMVWAVEGEVLVVAIELRQTERRRVGS